MPLYDLDNVDVLVGAVPKGEKAVLIPRFEDYGLELETDSGKKGFILLYEERVVGGYWQRDVFEGLCFAD